MHAVNIGSPADTFDRLLAKYEQQTDKQVQRLQETVQKLEDMVSEEQRKEKDLDAMRDQLKQMEARFSDQSGK